MYTCIKPLRYSKNITTRFPKCSFHIIIADPDPGLPREIEHSLVGNNVLTTRSGVKNLLTTITYGLIPLVLNFVFIYP